MVRPKSDRRSDALSRDRIVQAAIELLDADGEAGLTFRTLAAHLETGAGAIYWHLANKDELLAAATEALVTRALTFEAIARPNDAIRRIALALYDVIDAHPWVGTQLVHAPWQAAMREMFERLGREVQALGVAKKAQFFTASALMNHVLGVASQHAAAARTAVHGGDREAFLESMAERWAALEATTHPFLRQMAKQLRHHDDRVQFVAGIDLILAGIAAG